MTKFFSMQGENKLSYRVNIDNIVRYNIALDANTRKPTALTIVCTNGQEYYINDKESSMLFISTFDPDNISAMQ